MLLSNYYGINDGSWCVSYVLQAVRPELADKDEHEDQTGLESLMEGDQKHHTQLPGATTDGTSACTYMHKP